MMKFLLFLCLSTTTLAMPLPQDPQDWSQTQTWSDWAQGQTEDLVEPLYEVKDQVVQGWEWLQEFLPGKVTNYVQKTADDGLELLDDIYQETRDSIVEKTSDNVDDITGLGGIHPEAHRHQGQHCQHCHPGRCFVSPGDRSQKH